MTVEEQFRHLIETVKKYNEGANFALIEKAYLYAKEHHEGQLRKDGSPFISHPIAAAQIIAEDLHLNSETIAAALLHDCIEDTEATYEEIAAQFSPTIADLVEGVSKLTRLQYVTKEEEQAENLRKMLMAMTKDIRVILIKIADRLHNMRTMEYQSEEKQRQKSLETLEVYAPIAHRLGMQQIKWDLEDLAFKYIDPIAYAEITGTLAQKASEHKDFMDVIQKQISERLQQAHIPFRKVYGRIKHPYGIYRKMATQNKTMGEVLDIFAFRVIVDTIPDCYNVLGVIHDLYTPLLGRFKDYISTPKANLYQSLHTTVVSADAATPFEVQIRTQEMHDIAEYGVAAHWKYKLGIKGSSHEQSYEWVRRLLETTDATDAEEFIHSLKIDMFADEVFVFSPKGDVMQLPAGATPIDFAYAVHSAVGNNMVGAKVNTRIVPLDYVLQNGDIVEVLTAKNAHGPSRDWLSIAKSNSARSKIRQWFKRECREENIINGRIAFEAELKRVGIAIGEINDDLREILLKKTGAETMDDLYAAIGYSGYSAQKAVNRIRDEINRLAKQRQAERDATVPVPDNPSQTRPAVPTRKGGETGVVVQGLSNCLIKFSKCCTPVPGDAIIGFITRGYGISVHRCDCPNASEKARAADPSRWIKVDWGSDVAETYHTALDIYAKDRLNLMLDVSSVLSSTSTSVNSLHASTTGDGFAIIHLVISVSDSTRLSELMRKLHQIPNVMKVDRPAG